jgi:hypothetical protein
MALHSAYSSCRFERLDEDLILKFENLAKYEFIKLIANNYPNYVEAAKTISISTVYTGFCLIRFNMRSSSFNMRSSSIDLELYVDINDILMKSKILQEINDEQKTSEIINA